MAKENKSRYAILGMLSLGPMSGYNIKKVIEDSISNFWQESYGQIYPMLKQLREEGLTTSHVEKQQGRPDRYVYALTDKGWDELRRWLLEPVEYQVGRNELLLKLFFSRAVPVLNTLEHVERFRQLQLDMLRHYTAIDEVIKAAASDDSSHEPYWQITLNYGKHFARAMLAWCDETIATLRQMAESQQESDKEGK